MIQDMNAKGYFGEGATTEMNKVTGTGNWFEALMNSELSTIAQENVQSLLNGNMSAQEYCDMMAETYEATK